LSILPAIGILAVTGAGAAAVLHHGEPVQAVSAASSSSGAIAPQKDVLAAAASDSEPPATVTRSAERPPLPDVAAVEKKIEGLRYAVTPVEVHADAKTSSAVLAKVVSGDEVDITGRTNGKWAEIVHNGVPRWVEASALAAEMPLGTEPCPYGSEKGLQPDTVKVLRAVCAKFPSITSYGGIAGRGEHATGHALDIMVSSDLVAEVAGARHRIPDLAPAHLAPGDVGGVARHEQPWQRDGQPHGPRPRHHVRQRRPVGRTAC
jgi:hypothetical protein